MDVDVDLTTDLEMDVDVISIKYIIVNLHE